MKAKLTILMLSGLLAGGLAVLAQDTPAAEGAAPETTTVAVTNDTPQPGAVQVGAVIPLIVMDEVPLTDAIKNLARQANINYMLDPKIAFGQPDPTGKIVAQPLVSIRWENVTAEQALFALLNNYNFQMVEDPKTHIARISIKDPAAPDPLVNRVVQLKYASPSNMLAAVQSALTDKRSKVVGDVRTSQLVVLATEKEFNGVEQLIERLDTPTKQVLIEARLVETSMNPTTVKGIDWSGTLKAQNFSAGNNLQAGPVPDESVNRPLATSWPKLMADTAKGFNPGTAFLDADGVSAVLSFLNTDSDAQILATPRAVTLDNETADLSVTRALPIFKNTAGTQGSPGGSEVTYTNIGTILRVTPRITANNYVNLKVSPEVSSKEELPARKIVAGTVNEADIFSVRKIDTQVLIPSGNTLVLGGLVSDARSQGHTKVPLLGDIPGIGIAFRKDQKTRLKQNLLIFITPTIVTDTDFQPTTTAFLKSPVSDDQTEKDWSAWDSGKPKKWGKSKSEPAYGEVK